MSDSLKAHGLPHARLLCPSLSSGVCSNSLRLRWWCYLTVSSSTAHLSFAFDLSQHRVFSNESVHRIRWPKYWRFSFSISRPNEFSGLISFDCLDLLAVQALPVAGSRNFDDKSLDGDLRRRFVSSVPLPLPPPTSHPLCRWDRKSTGGWSGLLAYRREASGKALFNGESTFLME